MTLFGDGIFQEVTTLGWGHWGGPRSNTTGILMKGGNLDAEPDTEGRWCEDTQRQHHVKRRGTAVMSLHARERVGPQDAGLGMEQSSLDPSEQATPCQHLDFRLRLQNSGTISFCRLGHAVLGLLFQHPYKTNRPSKSTLKPFLMFRVGSKMIDFRRKWGARVGTHKLLSQSSETSRAVCTPIRQLSLWIWSPDRTGYRSSHARPSAAQLSWDLCSPDYETHPQWTTWGCFLKSSSGLPQFFPFPILRGSSHSVCI